jgi:hypothetical protein
VSASKRLASVRPSLRPSLPPIVRPRVQNPSPRPSQAAPRPRISSELQATVRVSRCWKAYLLHGTAPHVRGRLGWAGEKHVNISRSEPFACQAGVGSSMESVGALIGGWLVERRRHSGPVGTGSESGRPSRTVPCLRSGAPAPAYLGPCGGARRYRTVTPP